LLYLISIALILLYLLLDLYKAKQKDYLSYALPKLLMFISGCLADWSLAKLEFIQFAADGPTLPLWLVLLWLLFSITFEKCYCWLNGNLKVAALLGGLFGPASYWAASKLSSVNIQMPIEFTLLSAVFWATLFVTFIKKRSLAA
jgi:hypothetical protein